MPEKTACISIRITPLSASKYVGQRTHDLRLGEPPGYVDPGRTHLNTTLIEPPGLGNLKRHLADTKSRSSCRKKVVPMHIAYAGILTFSREAQIADLRHQIEDLSHRERQSVSVVRHLPAAERKRVEGNLGKLGRTDLAPGRPDRSRASTNQGFVSAG